MVILNKIGWRELLPYAAIIILIILWTRSCSKNSQDNSIYEHNRKVDKDSLIHYKNELGSQTASKLTYLYQVNELQDKLQQEAKNGTQLQKELAVLTKKFNKIVAAGSFEGQVHIDTIPFHFTDTIPCVFKPKRDSIEMEYYKAAYYLDNKQLLFTDLYIPTTGHIAFGYKEGGLFKKDEARVELTFNNPHIEVTSLTGNMITLDKNWYEKWWVWLITGIGLGGSGILIAK